ncbi:MAG: hypothetical protein IPK60_04100 [Sandaracinaceae bacterium]|jgi:adenylylsulfate kinase-like enzyme|nr:hypothetical protein [Sandaracinaceae bacterium]
MERDTTTQSVRTLLDGDEVREVLQKTFFSSDKKPVRAKAEGKKTAAKPDHYEVICISMYREDLSMLDEKVAALKAAGHRKMSRSGLIRFALSNVDLAKLPRAY